MKRALKLAMAGSAALLLSMMTLTALPGCDNKEDLLEIETPGSKIDVERDKETGEIDVEVDDK